MPLYPAKTKAKIQSCCLCGSSVTTSQNGVLLLLLSKFSPCSKTTSFSTRFGFFHNHFYIRIKELMSSVPVISVFLSKMLQLHKGGRPSLEPDTGGLSRADKQVRHKGSGAGSGALRMPSAPVGREAPAARSRHDGLGRRSPGAGGARPFRAPWSRVGTGSRSMGPCAGREPCEARGPLPGAM